MKPTLKTILALLCVSFIALTSISCNRGAKSEEARRMDSIQKAEEQKKIEEQEMKTEKERLLLNAARQDGRKYGRQWARECTIEHILYKKEEKKTSSIAAYRNIIKYEIESNMIEKCMTEYENGWEEGWNDYVSENHTF